MFKLHELTLIFLTLLLSRPTVFAQDFNRALFNRLSWNEIKPSSLAYDAMTADQIQGASILDQDGTAVLMAGKTHVWRWSLVDGAVSRATRHPDIMGRLVLVAANKGLIAGVDQRSGWIFTRKTKTWQRVDGSFEPDCQPKQVTSIPQPDPQKVYLWTECGAYVLMLDTLQLVTISKDFPEISNAETVQMTRTTDGAALLPAGHQLLKLQFDGPKIRQKLVYRAKSRIRGVIAAGGHYIAWTSQALIFFDQSLARIQVVPVLGRRKIQSFSADDHIHLVLFTDGAVEIMQPSSKLKWAATGYNAMSVAIVPDRGLAILSLEAGPPRVFSMANLH
jgi:hypothetical protein